MLALVAACIVKCLPIKKMRNILKVDQRKHQKRKKITHSIRKEANIFIYLLTDISRSNDKEKNHDKRFEKLSTREGKKVK